MPTSKVIFRCSSLPVECIPAPAMAAAYHPSAVLAGRAVRYRTHVPDIAAAAV